MKEFWVTFTGFTKRHNIVEPDLSEFVPGRRFKAFELPRHTRDYPGNNRVYGVSVLTMSGKRYSIWDGEYSIVPDSGALPERLAVPEFETN
jgi:hypothetical protein